MYIDTHTHACNVCMYGSYIHIHVHTNTHTHIYVFMYSYHFLQRFLMYIAHKTRNFAIITWGILVYMYTLQAVLQGWLPLWMGSTCEGHWQLSRSPFPVCQNLVRTPRYIYNALCVCVCAYMYVCVCTYEFYQKVLYSAVHTLRRSNDKSISSNLWRESYISLSDCKNMADDLKSVNKKMEKN